MFDSLGPHGLQPTRLLCPWNSPDKNIGVGCHFLLQLVAFRTIRNTEWYSENPSEITVFSPVCRAIEPRWPCNTCCQKLEKDPSGAKAPAPEAAGVPAQVEPPESPLSKQLSPPYSILTGAEVPEARENSKKAKSPVPMATRSPVDLAVPGSLWSKELHHTHTWSPPRQTQVLEGSLGSKLLWITHLEKVKVLVACKHVC